MEREIGNEQPAVVREYILIEDLAASDRPREKALRQGIRSLSTPELIAIIFGNGTRGKSVLTLSQELLAKNGGSLQALARKSINDVVRDNPGIGPAKAIALAAAIELGGRCRDENPDKKPRITGSDSVYALMRGTLELINHEEFWVITLSRSNRVLDQFRLSQGGTAATVVDVKLLLRRVLEQGDLVSSIILVHNHPSGTLTPSPEDDRLTARIAEAAKLIDIRVLDHLIIATGGYYSYADNGKMK